MTIGHHPIDEKFCAPKLAVFKKKGSNMRKLVTGLFVAGMSFGAVGAQAAQNSWSCVGGSYVCDSNAKSNLGANAPKQQAKRSSTGKQAKQASTSSPKKTALRGAAHGKASFYWQPQRVASGGWFNPNAMTAAHKTLPFGTKVRVTNHHNGRSVVVKINDRGPFVKGRIIDLSKAAAGVIGMQGAGVVPVSLEVLGKS